MFKSRPTKVKIKINNLINNLNVIKRVLDNRAEILAIVKANAYGHGAVEVAKALTKEGVKFLGVACGCEARELFNNNINANILSLGKIYQEDILLSKNYPYIMTISCFSDIECLQQVKHTVKVHLKVDTGMGRSGFWPDYLKSILDKIKANNFIKLEGVITHFPSADKDVEFTKSQIKLFNDIKLFFSNEGFDNLLFHCANSDSIINFKNSYFNLVRPGIILYGSYWNLELKKKLQLKPVMEFSSNIVDIKYFKNGDSIGYGRTFKVDKEPFKAALVPVGYADGYSRYFSNKGYVLIKNKICNVVGRVSMDWIMVDISNINAVVGDEVVLFGDDNFIVDIDALSNIAGTISYEILCNVGKNNRKNFIYKNF